MRIFFALVLLTLLTSTTKAQSDTLRKKTDTSSYLREVTVNAYFNYQPLLNAPFTVNTIDSSLIHANHGMSLLPVLNLGPGIRMEERSPGSYRLSIRGSLLRSPFGVRNVKIYLDEFSLTDASGNTYLNLVDISTINRMEILRGPDASLFGANTGGVLRLQPFDMGRDTNFVQAGMSVGAYGFWRENVQTRQKLGKHIFALNESWQRSDGYRQNSSMDRKSFTLSDQWFYAKNAQIKLYALYSDLQYLTPGGLTLQQWNENPRAARPATATVPGATEQKAGVHDKTFFGGLSHEIKFGKHFRHVLAVFGQTTNFKNPFITNYEIRGENNLGLRTWLEFSTDQAKDLKANVHLGFEGQQGWYNIRNYGNHLGNTDTLQAADHFNTRYGFGFVRLSTDYKRKLSLELSLSNNYNWYFYNSLYPAETPLIKRNFRPQLMPRAAFSWKIMRSLSWRAIVSRGYSPPTLAEIRTANNIINTALEPEKGWNYETGFRFKTPNTRVYVDLAGFYFGLDNAIVRRSDNSGIEYFVNAGGTKQWGAELQFDIIAVERDHGWIRKLKLCRSYTFSYFKFGQYRNGENNYSGNFVTGVPRHLAITGAEAELAHRIYVFIQYQITSKIPLNDANTVYSKASHLVQIKLTWTTSMFGKFRSSFFAGVDNLLDWKYSLGYDLNAAGERYYNAAPGRNFYGGFSVVF
jgi:iron complex outermembrane receptor protein